MITAHIDDCIFVSSRIFTSSKTGKELCMLSFLYDECLYADVFVDGSFAPIINSLVWGDHFGIDFRINRYDGNWRVSVDSITM